MIKTILGLHHVVPSLMVAYDLLKRKKGSCGGASSRAVAFCPSRQGSIPGTDLLGFFRFRIAANLFSLGAGLFLKNEE